MSHSLWKILLYTHERMRIRKASNVLLLFLTLQTHKNVSEGSSGLPRKHFLTLKKKWSYTLYTINFTLSRSTGDSLVVQWLGLKVPMLGVWVQSLVEGLRAHEMCSEAKKKKRKEKTDGSIVFSMFTKLCNYLCISNLYPLPLIPTPDNHWSTFFF